MAFVTALVWALSRRYTGLTQDGELYAMQALSRLVPGLRGDLYLANTSQDQFTIFSPLYAFLIGKIGLWNAGVAIFVGARALFYAATWLLIRRVSDSVKAWLSLAFLTAASCQYGAYGVFSFAEGYLTARSVAEALVVTAILLVTYRRPVAAWSVIALSFFIHPLMTLPGCLVLVCLSIQPRRALVAAASGIASAGAVALVASHSHLSGPLQLIDGQWLDVVRQRSQFLFLEEWQWRDWRVHLRPILCLLMAYQALPERRVRTLCVAVGLVGLSGLMLAWIAGSIGPVAILLQSQPWRWFWLTTFTSIALLGPVVAALWRSDGAGRLSAALVAVSWIFPLIDGVLVLVGAVIIWALRRRFSPAMLRFLELAAGVVIVTVGVWATVSAWSSISSPLTDEITEGFALGHLRSIFQYQPFPVLLSVLALWWLRSLVTDGAVLAATAATVYLLFLILPGALAQRTLYGTPAEARTFSDWKRAIPEGATVLPVPVPAGSMFTWFTLQRATYLSLDQSAGVVFSRATASEVVRRSEVLRPIMEPDYQIKRRLRAGRTREEEQYPLTDASLRQICADPQLGFVISSENLSFPSLLHTAPGAFKNHHLYDCDHARARELP